LTIPNPPEAIARVNTPIPGAEAGGMIEATKRAVISALRREVTGTELGAEISGSQVKVDMEYPMTLEAYPGIWVQFSFTKLQRAGLGWEVLTHTTENPGTPEERINWEPVREFIFEGRVTLSIVALTSLERDRIADAVVASLMFARPPELVLTDPTRDIKQYRSFLDSLSKNPFISLSVNLDIFNPGGQAVTTGVPWDPDILGYEDTYSFDILGQTNITFKHDGTYTLTRVDPDPQIEGHATPYDPTQWQ
jgi:hypothetical protein